MICENLLFQKEDAEEDTAPNFNFAAEPFNGQVISKEFRISDKSTPADLSQQDLTHAQLDNCADEEEQLEEELFFEDDSHQQDDDYIEVEILTSHEEDQYENASFPLVELGALSGEVDTEDNQTEDYWEVMKDNEILERSQNLTKHPLQASAMIL
ncbi:unnamed protein product [Cylicostephanus goldi]|uniref:Uncharacterized protein n=1 Tax=Cylicostephanus goldi TaxID=71465 RepID=A0A3P6QTG6_CYLGO|nr:unnamed protein product [Cylicostephanus goldi]